MNLILPEQKLSINIEKDNKLIEIRGTINQVFDDRITIELPQYFMRYVECLDVGKHLTIKIFTKLGTIDFNTVVITSPLEDDFTVELDYNAIKLTPDEEMQPVESIEKMIIKKKNGEEHNVSTLDIAPEIIRISCDYKLDLQENVDCELILPDDYGTIFFKATVIKHDKIYDDEYTLSCYAMDDEARQSLLYYMYIYTNNFNQQE